MNTKITSGKRMLSVLLTVIMVFSMAPTPVFAADDTCSHVDYSPVDGKCDNCGETMPGSENAVALLIQDNVSVYMDSLMSLQTALDGTASTGGGTVYLLSDIGPGEEEDIFSIAGPDEIILDLNGYHISDFNVGWQYFDEEKGEVTRSLSGHVTIRDSRGGGGITGQTWVFSNDNPSVAPSTLTVEGGTFSSEDNIDTMSGIQLENGTVTVNGGMVWNLGCSGGSGTVNIAGGSVKKVSGINPYYDDETGAEGQYTIHVTGGSEHSGYWDVSGGTWYISAGTFGEVVFVDPDTQRQDVVISGGTFEKISTVSSRGSSFNAPLSALLADGYAFYSQNADGSAYDTCENAAGTTVLNKVSVKYHTHIIGEDGACAECGKSCGHIDGNINYDSGICETCGKQLEAAVQYKDGAVVGFESFLSALDSVPHNMTEEVTVVLLQNYELNSECFLNVSNNIRLDLNTHTISGTGSFIVKGASELTLAHGNLGENITVEAAGGDLTVAEDFGNAGTIRVTDEESKVSIQGGSIQYLRLSFIDTETLKNIKLTGGKFGTIDFNADGKVAITDMLEANYAFKDNKGVLSGKAGSLMPYGRTWSASTYFSELEVVPCDHSAANAAMGYCNYCGKLYAARVVDQDGNTRYIENITDWDLILTENCVVTLFQDADQCKVAQNLTLNLNGHHVNTLDLSVTDGTVTLKGSGSIDNLYLGHNSNGNVADTTLVIDAASAKTLYVDNFVVLNSSNTKLTGISFSHMQRQDGRSLNDLLADGYAFFDKDSGKPMYLGSQTDIMGSYSIDQHDHTFTVNADGKNECECGLICDHTNIGEDGKCESCKTQIYFAVLTAADGTETKYKAFADAWTAAIENSGSTLKLLGDVDLGEEDLTLDHGKFTLDLGGFTLTCFAYQQLLEVSGTADLRIRNGELYNTFNTLKGGQLFYSTGNVIEMRGGSVALDGVTLQSAWKEDSTLPDGEMQCYALEQYDGTLIIENSSFIGALAVYRQSEENCPTTKITSAVLYNGLIYAYMGKEPYTSGFDFWAEGSMLLDENGKYIDTANDSYWQTGGDEESGSYYAMFSYEDSANVTPHEHTFVDGVCSECDYACPHNSGNEREASYFEKAICAVCHAEYGDFAPDTTEPTGKIIIQERTWWESFLNTISFGLFYKEVKVEITAADDSYEQPGFDASKHAVAIGYLISDTVLSEETVKNSSFTEYTGAFDLSDEQQYVIYVRLTDYAGNAAYISTDGFEIDKTAPMIEGMENDGVYYFCGEKTITVKEKNINKVTLDGTETALDENGQLTLPTDSNRHKIIVTDKAGNETTVYITVFPAHNFDPKTDTCLNCGIQAAAKVEKGEISDRFANGDELFQALEDEKYSGATVTLLTDVTITDFTHLKNDLTIDLNGKTLQPDSNIGITIDSGAITILSSNGEGACSVALALNGTDASLTMGEGIGDVKTILIVKGKFTVYSGRYGMLSSMYRADDEAEHICLYGGSFRSIYLKTAFCSQILGKGYRFDGVSREDAQKTSMLNVSVIPCDHADTGSDNICPVCGMEMFLSVEANGTTKLFGTFESAIRYAEQNAGCTVKLLQDITLDEATAGSLMSSYYINFETGEYTLDLAGKALNINGKYFNVYDGCQMTISDSVGGGKITDSNMFKGRIAVDERSKLTVTGGDFAVELHSSHRNALTLKGGSFKAVIANRSVNRSPFVFIEDGYTFALSDGTRYANDGDVSSIGGVWTIEDVSVVKVPVRMYQIEDATFYLTSADTEKYLTVPLACYDLNTDNKITLTLEKTDGTMIMSKEYDTSKVIVAGFSLKDLTESSDLYRVKAEFNGYIGYSGTFRITAAVCEHPGYDKDHKCIQCGCDLAAAVVKDGQTNGYVTFAEALAAAQTDENKGCTLKMFVDVVDVNEKVAVKTGSFTLDATDCKINGALNVAKGADLTVSGGEITGNVICAKGGKLTASDTYFEGIINYLGSGDFRNCIFMSAVSPKSGSMKLNSCEIHGALSVSGNAEAEKCVISGTVTVNNGGSFQSTGDTTYSNTVNVKSGGTLEVIRGIFGNILTAEEGSKLIISGGSYAKVEAENNVDFTINGGKFTHITVSGQFLIDCLADGKALEDLNIGEVIDGRVGIAGNVQVVDHTHTCVWKTETHEKLCGCGYVEAVDTEAPVISGIDPENNHYGSLEFTVTDANDFTVWMDDEEITLVNGKYTMEPDNEIHLITANDVAGNTVSFRFGLFKIYNVTLPTGAGYTIFHSDGLTVRHGNSFSFIVQFNKGYSKTEDFRVLVNGNKLDELMSDADSASFVVRDVSEDLVITIEGVADITAPEVEVSIRGNSFKEFLNRITFGLFFKQTQTVEVKANDFGSGVDKVEYLLSETPFANKDAIIGNWTAVTLDGDRKAYFSIAPSQKTFVYVRVTDKSGNITVVNSEGVVVYTDAEAITGTRTFTMGSDFDMVYLLSMNGNSVSAVYNGTEKLSDTDYLVSKDGSFTLKNSYLTNLAADEYTFRLTFNPMGEDYVDNYGNDAPTEVLLKLTVEKKTPIHDHASSDGKIYDGKSIGMPTFNTDSDGAVTLEYKRADEDDTAYTTEAPKNVGKYTIRITTAETDTFKAATSTMEFEIQPKDVTISDTLVLDKEYNGNTDAIITSVGTVKGLADGDDVTIAVGKATFADKNVGANKTVTFSDFSLSGSDASNYTLISQPSAVTASIMVKEIAINGAEVESTKVYDGTTAATITNIGTPSENFDGDDLTVIPGTAAYDDKNVGTAKTVTFSGFTLSGEASANYTVISQPADTMADITAKEITIVGAQVEQTKVYDGTTAATVTNAGAPSVNYDGENLRVAAGKAAYDNKNVGKGKAVTFTGFVLEGDAAANYKLTAQPEAVTADITVKEIKIIDTTVETSKVYDGSADAKITSAGALDGLVDGDDVTILSGKAAFADKNVGSGKTVTFSGFSLAGEDAGNYVLAAQPESTTASITPKELTIADLKVKDKQYDGKNTAEIDGTPVLVGVVDGDVLELVNGTPTFDSVAIGKNIPIRFTAFTLSGDSVTVGNYTLAQPSGITANIVEYVADGSEYDVNSNDWIHTDFVITAKEGYKLSLTGTPDGEWTDTLTASDETDNGELTFFVKNTETGVISAAVTEHYKIDKTAPTGEVKLNERTAFQEFINKITFGLFFKEDVNVQLTATDEASGVKSVQYYKSDTILTDTEVRAVTDWTDNSDFGIKAKDKDKFIIYVRIEDHAGNVAYIGSDGATFDTTAPKIIGVENAKTYYVTKKVAIDDENFESVTLNGEPAEAVFTLTGDTEATYIIRAVDKAGNVTEYTVYMRPISSITDALSGLTVDHVKSSDGSTISAVERQLLDLIDAFDNSESTSDEWNKLTEAAAKCKELNKRITEVADEINRLTEAVNGYEIDKVTSADQADIEKMIADIDTLLDGDNLMDTERAALEALKGTARTLLDRIAEAKDAAEAEEIQAADGITKDTVKLEDKETLEKAEKALEEALRDFGGNYTEEERKDLETKLATVKEALAAIGNAEKTADEIAKLPKVDDGKLSDKDEVDRVKEIIDGLTENEKTMLGKDALDKVNALAEKIQRLAEEAGKSDAPKTGDTSNLALWSALFIISGGVLTGTIAISKKKRRSVK